jgi:large subunit ribosomal protein L22
MEVKAVQKYVRMSPRKLRLVADAVRQMNPQDALETLPFLKKRAAEPLSKVIKTALSNAKNMGLTESKLKFKEIQIQEGPRLKRGRPVSRGMWHPYQRKMSHIKVVLDAEGKIGKENKKKMKPTKEKTKSVKDVITIKDKPSEKKREMAGKDRRIGLHKTDRVTVRDRKSVRTTNK